MTETNGSGPKPKREPRPYRDSALVYAFFGLIVIVLAIVTGGHVLWAVVAAIGAFVLATGWTWRNLRKRERTR